MPAKKIAGKKGHAEKAGKPKQDLVKGKQVQESKKPETKKAESAEQKDAHVVHTKEEAEKAKHAEHEVKKAETEKGKHADHEAKKAETREGKRAQRARQEAELKKRPKIAKSKQVKRLSRLVRAKRRFMFRGRFGKRSERKVSKKKWQKWRQPRGIDIYFYREDGLVPGTGYKVAKEIRFVHPSGYRERLVRNMDELLSLEAEKASVAARISHTIGKKKKSVLLRKADELNIVVLNR